MADRVCIMSISKLLDNKILFVPPVSHDVMIGSSSGCKRGQPRSQLQLVNGSGICIEVDKPSIRAAQFLIALKFRDEAQIRLYDGHLDIRGMSDAIYR
jgi:hypothetical protein